MKQNVLDKGFVEVIDNFGSDLTVVNSVVYHSEREKKSLLMGIEN